MNYLLPETIPQWIRDLLIPCQWGEFIEENKEGKVIARYKVSKEHFPKVRPLCKIVTRRPLRNEPTTYKLGDIMK